MLKRCHVKLPRIKLKSKINTTDNAKTVKEYCANCKLTVDNIEDHHNISLICRQAHELLKDQQKHSTQEHKKQPKKNKLSKGKSEKVKCKSCLNEYSNINTHLSKAFSCQNSYEIERAINESFEREGSIEDYHSSIKPESPSEFEQNKTIKTQCSFCSKSYINIWLHLKKSKKCQEIYDMEEVERKHNQLIKEKNKLRVQKYRNSRDEKQKDEEHLKDRRRKQDSWNSKDEKQKEEELENHRKRMKESRKTKDEKQKEEEDEKHRKNMKESRNSRDEKKKKVDEENDRKRKIASRPAEDDTARQNRRAKEKEIQRQFRIKQLLLNPQEYRNSVSQNKANSRNNQINTEEGRRTVFQKSIKYGPIFGCVCCHRLCFDTNVICLKETFVNEMEECHPGLFEVAIGSYNHVKRVDNSYHLCITCKGYMFRGKVPPMSHKNNLEVFSIQDFPELLLSELNESASETKISNGRRS